MTIIIAGILLGLTSSLHCIGMCGPIAMAIPLNRSSQGKMLLGIGAYNIGRAFTYGILGMVVGSFGMSLATFGVLQWISIVAGVLLIIYAWRKYLSKLSFSWAPKLNLNKYLNGLFGKIMRSDSKGKLFFLGMINGLLPCGMVYIALLNAILAGTIYEGAAAMVAFGIGTMPAMIAVSYTANRITGNLRVKLNGLVPYVMTVVGLLIVLRGLNLGIPYISPEIKISQEQSCNTDDSGSGDVEMSCCHK